MPPRSVRLKCAAANRFGQRVCNAAMPVPYREGDKLDDTVLATCHSCGCEWATIDWIFEEVLY